MLLPNKPDTMYELAECLEREYCRAAAALQVAPSPWAASTRASKVDATCVERRQAARALA